VENVVESLTEIPALRETFHSLFGTAIHWQHQGGGLFIFFSVVLPILLPRLPTKKKKKMHTGPDNFHHISQPAS
jgi:hypothetical protein